MNLLNIPMSPMALLNADLRTIDSGAYDKHMADEQAAKDQATALGQQREDQETRRNRWRNGTPGGANVSEDDIAKIEECRIEQLQAAAAARAAAANARQALAPRFAAVVDPHRRAAGERILAAFAEIAAAFEILEMTDRAAVRFGLPPHEPRLAGQLLDLPAKVVAAQVVEIAGRPPSKRGAAA